MALSSVGMFGDGNTQGKPVSSQYIAAPPAAHLDHLDVGADAKVLVEQSRQLADRHSMTRGDRELADERLASWLQGDPFHFDPANRIRPIADDDLDAMLARRAHAIGHRVHVGVDPSPDVLEVDHEHVDPVQHLRRRLSGIAVERIKRHAPFASVELSVRRLDHVVLDIRSKAVLGPEQRDNVNRSIAKHQIDDVPERRDRRMRDC